MRRHRTFGLLGLGLVAICVLLVTSIHHQAPFAHCDFTVGERFHYDLDMAGRSRMVPENLVASGQPSQIQTTNISYDAELLVQVQAVSETTANLQMQLRNSQPGLEFNPQIIPDLEQPFFVTMDRACRIQQIGFPGYRVAAAKETIHLLLQAIEFELPEDRGLSEWTNQEEDSLGEMTVSYKRAGQQLTRSRQQYDRVAAPNQAQKLSAEIVTSNSIATFSEDKPWLMSTDVDERVRLLTADNKLFADVTSRVVLQRRAAAPPADAIAATTKAIAWRQANDFNYQQERRSAFDQLPPPSPRLRSYQQLLAFYESDLAGPSGPARQRALRELISYLRLHPAEIGDVLETLATRSDRVATWLVFALEKVGTAASERALVALVQNEDMAEMNRIRGLHALADTTSLSAQGLTVMQDYGRRFGEHGREVEAAAVLAMGTIGRNYERSHAYHQAVADDLRDMLGVARSSSDERQITTVLAAAGNFRDPQLTEQVATYLEADSVLIRANAAKVLASFCQDDCLADLTRQLDREPEDYARGALIDGLIDRGLTVSDTVPLGMLASRLVSEPNPQLRAKMIRAMGPAAELSEELREQLARHYHQEPSAKVKRELGRYLSAYQIARASKSKR